VAATAVRAPGLGGKARWFGFLALSVATALVYTDGGMLAGCAFAYGGMLAVGLGFGVLGGILPSVTSPLFKAAEAGATAEVETLLRRGADPEDGIRAAVPLEFVGLLHATTPLHVAAQKGDTAAVAALLEAGARPEAGGMIGPLGALFSSTPLSAAAAKGDTEAVAALLEGGGRPEVGEKFGPLGALWSTTPLYHAVGHGNTVAVEALLEAGARPEAGLSVLFGLLPGQTPLAKAANEATKTALRAAIARAAGDKEL
jgi:ankyrin repeat protein